MTWHQFADSSEQRFLAAGVPERQVFRQKAGFKLRADFGVLQQSFDFGGEGEQPSVPEIVERLDAQPVARAEQGAGVLVPQREGKHPPKTLDAVGAELLVGVDHGFGIAGGAIAVPGLFQLRAYGRVVEDLAVVDDPQAAVLVGHRLLAGGQVDDAQAAVAQMSPSVLVVTEGIGTTMLQHRSHAL